MLVRLYFYMLVRLYVYTRVKQKRFAFRLVR